MHKSNGSVNKSLQFFLIDGFTLHDATQSPNIEIEQEIC